MHESCTLLSYLSFQSEMDRQSEQSPTSPSRRPRFGSTSPFLNLPADHQNAVALLIQYPSDTLRDIFRDAPRYSKFTCTLHHATRPGKPNALLSCLLSRRVIDCFNGGRLSRDVTWPIEQWVPSITEGDTSVVPMLLLNLTAAMGFRLSSSLNVVADLTLVNRLSSSTMSTQPDSIWSMATSTSTSSFDTKATTPQRFSMMAVDEFGTAPQALTPMLPEDCPSPNNEQHGRASDSDAATNATNTHAQRYYCTFSASCAPGGFARESDMKKHEAKYHEARTQWTCLHCDYSHPECPSKFLLEAEFRAHHAVDHVPCNERECFSTRRFIKRVYACGFRGCTYITTDDGREDEFAWDRRCKHVAAEIRAGRTFEDWNYSVVIRNLLCQPRIHIRWLKILQREFGIDDTKWPSLNWIPRQPDVLKLQLETHHFVSHQDQAEAEAIDHFLVAALRSATPTQVAQYKSRMYAGEAPAKATAAVARPKSSRTNHPPTPRSKELVTLHDYETVGPGHHPLAHTYPHAYNMLTMSADGPADGKAPRSKSSFGNLKERFRGRSRSKSNLLEQSETRPEVPPLPSGITASNISGYHQMPSSSNSKSSFDSTPGVAPWPSAQAGNSLDNVNCFSPPTGPGSFPVNSNSYSPYSWGRQGNIYFSS